MAGSSPDAPSGWRPPPRNVGRSIATLCGPSGDTFGAMNTTANTSLSAAMRALRELDRMAGVEREGRKFAHTGARFKIPRVHQAQRSAQRWLPATTFFGSARIRVEGSGSSFDRQQKEEALRKTSARIGLSNHPGSITADTSSIIR